MKPKVFLKEKATHGTALVPIAIHHLSYEAGVDTFFYLHWHYEFELVVVLSGALVYTVEDQEYTVNTGEGLFIHSNQLHAARSLNGLPCEACVVVFHPNLFGSSNQSGTYSKFVSPIIHGDLVISPFLDTKLDWHPTVLARLAELDNLRDAVISENELLLKSKLFEIWHLLFQHASITSNNLREKSNYKLDRLEPVLHYIQAHFNEEISLITLANLLPMSEGQFCRTFKEVMNMTPIAYVIRYRILQSCRLLTESSMKISDISRNIGFNNISYFNREFIKAIGCSPSHYRRDGV